MSEPIVATLKKAAEGLLYPSETDAPFEVFSWEYAPNSAASVRRLAGHPSEKCRQVSLEDFLQDLMTEPDFQNLKRALESTLNGIRVYRFGATDPTYYVVGADATGCLVGLKTSAVET